MHRPATQYRFSGKIKFDANGDTLNKTITLCVVKSGAWVPKANNLAK